MECRGGRELDELSFSTRMTLIEAISTFISNNKEIHEA